ncbi:hypothetical protein BYT27DRAFT_7194465 [Phlegmacium glaucopus]|nr:hypothetical protein BYT27DRAFT_7194465 [Phlegmacium glaucopus]
MFYYYPASFTMSLLKSVYIFVIACTVGQAVAKNSARPATFKRNVHPSQLATSVGASGSAKIDGLLLTSSQRKRQGTCEFTGGRTFYLSIKPSFISNSGH